MFENWNPKDTELMTIYVYYDRPISYSCVDKDGNFFIAVFSDETDNCETWLYLSVSYYELELIAKNSDNLFAVWEKPENGTVIVSEICDGITAIQVKDISSINKTLLPIRTKG